MTKLSACLVAFMLSCLTAIYAVPAPGDLKAVQLRTEYKEQPFTDVQIPRLSWELISPVNGQYQTAYQILVASSPELLKQHRGDLWNSGRVAERSTNQVEYAGKPLKPGQIAYWKIRSWDKKQQAGEWSEPSMWEMGLISEQNWKASWIGYDLNQYGKGGKYHLPPAPYLRKERQLKKGIKRARLYVTALGLYEFYINGQRIGNDYFAPGWTDYNKRVYYQAYDITHQLLPGNNSFGALLSYGWYAGYLGYAKLVGSSTQRAFYGDVPLLRAQIQIEYENGSTDTILTDGSWKASAGPLRESDILQGETYDARLELGNWNQPLYDDKGWRYVAIYPNDPKRIMRIYPGNPVQVYAELAPVNIREAGGEKYIIDFGQNFAGLVRINVKGKRGDSVILRYGEMLHPDASLMTENLRMARATDTYILKGSPEAESWSPQFTYHGFRYVEVSGLSAKPSPDAIKGIVLSSSTPAAGVIETDHAMLNQLYNNIVWTQRANYFDIPTDCPQRDERLGWTGDAQIYMKSAAFNSDISAFHTKWITDLNDSQWPNGAYPVYAPMPVSKTGKAAIRETDTYSPGWYEAGIICPYEIYKTYSDTRIIRNSWAHMLRFMDFLKNKSRSQYVFKEAAFEDIKPKGGFGDWLSIGRKTSPDLLATLYYGYCAAMMEEMAFAIGKKQEAARFAAEFTDIKKAFKNHYTDPSGKFIVNARAYGDGTGYVDGSAGFEGHTQTAYANALYMNMLDLDMREKAGRWLHQLVMQNGESLTTGFLGFKPLLPALSASGNSATAYHLLSDTSYPSLGYEVVNGATSIWERWDSYTKEKGFKHNAAMNSFSHYAFGAVTEWMFSNMAGIRATTPGYRTFIIKPEIAREKINYVKATYHSVNGIISSSWKRSGDKLRVEIVIPVNTSAEVYIPVRDNSIIPRSKELMRKGSFEQGYRVYKVGSGSYSFESEL